MGELKEYAAVVNGTETTLRLTEDEAKARGLSGGKKLHGGEPDDASKYDPADAAADAASANVEAASDAKAAATAANKARTAPNK